MQIGRYRVDIIETCRFALDGGAMFGVVPKNLWAKAYPHVDEQNRIAMAARALLVRGEDRVIVVDAGCGDTMGPKLEAIYAVDNSVHTLDAGLERHGVHRSDVTDFIYTHLHFDHAGGSTRMADGALVPTFPNARHYVQRDHLHWALNPTEKDRASFMPENWQPVVEHELLETLDGPGMFAPDIELRTVHGHTRAMQLLVVHGGAGGPGGLVYCADLFPTSAHVPVPYVMGYDNFPLTTIEEKRAMLSEAHERGWLLAFEHDAFTDAARIEPGTKGFTIAERITL